ncbi:unnamed protein product [Rotaria sordida]|uniref:Uncharacterized protein n=1 Tax=Rotaria sordida TaxID=392033 RepID=A0A814K674_9BILA|nr:unnamed protein product [Rotaria sordida]CAF1208797.1 unnamed protein product [Rotaria sordida]
MLVALIGIPKTAITTTIVTTTTAATTTSTTKTTTSTTTTTTSTTKTTTSTTTTTTSTTKTTTSTTTTTTTTGTNIVAQNQIWLFSGVTMSCPAASKVMDIPASNAAPNTYVIAWSSSGGTNQQWTRILYTC